jgi:hypothetical protein
MVKLSYIEYLDAYTPSSSGALVNFHLGHVLYGPVGTYHGRVSLKSIAKEVCDCYYKIVWTRSW